MKNNALLIAWTAITTVIAVWFFSSYAGNSNMMGNNYHNRSYSSWEMMWNYRQNNWSHQNMMWERWNRQLKWNYQNMPCTSSWNIIENIEKSDMSQTEIDTLKYQYSEEMLARDIYKYFYEKYSLKAFNNISSSEQKHMDELKLIFDRYEIALPSDYWVLKDKFNELKSVWEKSLKDALEVWMKIEMKDIDDIKSDISKTDNKDFQYVLDNIWWASYNHLRSFIKTINNNWIKTEIDYSKYLSENEINSRWNLNKIIK